MRRRILLATDLSARCDRAFDRAADLARDWGARLTIATVLKESPDDLAEQQSQPSWRRSDSRAADAEALIREDAEDKGIDIDVVIRHGRAAEVIPEIAREASCDLIVTGIARNTGFTRSILGATVEAVLRDRAGPVLVVKQRARRAYGAVLVGTDFSDGARTALRCVSTLFPQSSLTVLHAYRTAVGRFANIAEADRAAQTHALGECNRFVSGSLSAGAGAVHCVAAAGFPETLLNQYAHDRKIDLMALGTGRRNRMVDLVFGSTCGALILSSPCDLLLVPEPSRA